MGETIFHMSLIKASSTLPAHQRSLHSALCTLHQQIMQLRINIPPLTRVLLGLLIAISAAHQTTRYLYGGIGTELLALIPQLSLFYPWVYITATFAEQNGLTLLIAGPTILYGGRYLERAWGSREFGKFVLLVTILPNVAATLMYILWFAITRDDTRAYVEMSLPLSVTCS